ncbi:unnamed protein product [Arabidopsis halleri]
MNNSKKRRTYNEPPRRERKPNTAIANDQLIYLPKEMIGFGVPNRPGLMMNRAVPVPDIACGPPFFYYENVAMAPKASTAQYNPRSLTLNRVLKSSSSSSLPTSTSS